MRRLGSLGARTKATTQARLRLLVVVAVQSAERVLVVHRRAVAEVAASLAPSGVTMETSVANLW